jgi:hypothetical protein
MIGSGSGVDQTGPDVLGFKVGIIRKYLSLANAGRQQFEHILYPDAHAPDTGPPATLIRVEGDPVHDVKPYSSDHQR